MFGRRSFEAAGPAAAFPIALSHLCFSLPLSFTHFARCLVLFLSSRPSPFASQYRLPTRAGCSLTAARVRRLLAAASSLCAPHARTAGVTTTKAGVVPGLVGAGGWNCRHAWAVGRRRLRRLKMGAGAQNRSVARRTKRMGWCPRLVGAQGQDSDAVVCARLVGAQRKAMLCVFALAWQGAHKGACQARKTSASQLMAIEERCCGRRAMWIALRCAFCLQNAVQKSWNCKPPGGVSAGG